ncbi:hypothetical protein D9619_003832 [Psilocybe cf. subviscida]|uniref:Uncharacterized protein n=1 Tax=Psilocybe cf. subviscida TaxID=2480587 RepID=A0A8H5EUM3_9AGAR|nr:hypothetical protein D9619_003832 [Psilocybe cf. subviscida]
MMLKNLFLFIASASVFTIVNSQALENGYYLIKSVQGAKLACNFAGTQSPTTITFTDFSKIDAKNFIWQVSKGLGDSGYTLTNLGSGNKAAAAAQEVGAHVDGFSNIATQFAIEFSGNGTFAIKSPNQNLFWAVFQQDEPNIFMPFLEPASGGDEEKFLFIAANFSLQQASNI